MRVARRSGRRGAILIARCLRQPPFRTALETGELLLPPSEFAGVLALGAGSFAGGLRRPDALVSPLPRDAWSRSATGKDSARSAAAAGGLSKILDRRE